MTEFFHNCTTNERKREIGECKLLLGAAPGGSLLPADLSGGHWVVVKHSRQKCSAWYRTGISASPAEV